MKFSLRINCNLGLKFHLLLLSYIINFSAYCLHALQIVTGFLNIKKKKEKKRSTTTCDAYTIWLLRTERDILFSIFAL